MAEFKFKQFEIHQDRCAMKVGTDGVLLGAWAPGGKRILDIGSGTGLISLMMAQRCQKAQACENVAARPFADRVSIVCCRLQDYESVEKFDAIVSNPPFFLNSLKNPDSKRSMARHADSLPFRDLFLGVKRLLSEEGVFSAIVPSEILDAFTSEAYLLGFCLVRQCGVKTVERKQPKRFMLTFARHRTMKMENTIEVMMDSDGNRSEWYTKITEEFYVS